MKLPGASVWCPLHFPLVGELTARGALWCSGKHTRLVIRRVFPTQFRIPLVTHCDEDGVSSFISTLWPNGGQKIGTVAVIVLMCLKTKKTHTQKKNHQQKGLTALPLTLQNVLHQYKGC